MHGEDGICKRGKGCHVTGMKKVCMGVDHTFSQKVGRGGGSGTDKKNNELTNNCPITRRRRYCIIFPGYNMQHYTVVHSTYNLVVHPPALKKQI